MNHPLIIADSHGVSLSAVFGELKDAWESDGTAPVAITREGQKVGAYYVLNSKSSFFVRIDAGHGSVIDVHPDIKERIGQEVGSYDGCLLSIDGNVHMAHFMCQNGTPFDFYEPAVPNFIGENRQVIPTWAVDKFFMRGRDLLAAKLGALKNVLARMPIYFVAPPLPIPSQKQIHDQSEIFNFSVQQLENPYLRLKVFHAYCRSLESLCTNLGIAYVPPNSDARDSEGFLLEDYWLGATHAKPEYYSFLTSL